MSSSDDKSLPGTPLSRKERLRARARDFKDAVNMRSEKRYEMYLEMKLSSPEFVSGCSMTDALQGKDTFLNCYKAYKEHNNERTAQRSERYLVHEKLADIIGVKFEKVNPLKEEFDDCYFTFLGIVHQMGFGLVNLDEASTKSVIQVFEDEMKLNGSENFISQDFTADVINVTDYPTSNTAEANTEDFKRIILQSGSSQGDEAMSVLKMNSGMEEKSIRKSGNEIITRDLNFLKILEQKGIEKIVLYNNQRIMNKNEMEISPEAKLVANLIYDQLDCPTKYK